MPEQEQTVTHRFFVVDRADGHRHECDSYAIAQDLCFAYKGDWTDPAVEIDTVVQNYSRKVFTEAEMKAVIEVIRSSVKRANSNGMGDWKEFSALNKILELYKDL